MNDLLNVNVKFCYTCLKLYSNDCTFSRMNFSAPGDTNYKTKLKYCVPEMNLDSTEDSLLCKQCTISLDTSYLFRSMCLRTEGKLAEYRQNQANKSSMSCEYNVHNIKQEPIDDQDMSHATTLQPEQPQELGMFELSEYHHQLTQVDDGGNNSMSSTSDTTRRRGGVLLQVEGECVVEQRVELADVKGELGTLLTEKLGKSIELTRISRRKTLPQQQHRAAGRLSDMEIVQRCIQTIPELRNYRPENLQCAVAVEKLVVRENPVKLNFRNLSPIGIKRPDVSISLRSTALPSTSRTVPPIIIKQEPMDHPSPIMAAGAAAPPLPPMRLSRIDMMRNRPKPGITVTQPVRYRRLKHVPSQMSLAKQKQLKIITKRTRSSTSPGGTTWYHCDQCNYRSQKKRVVQIHKMRHVGLRQFECRQCPKSFYENWELNRHIRDVHENPLAPPQRIMRNRRVTPLLIKSEIIAEDDEDDNREMTTRSEHHCKVCDTDFSTLAALQNHIKVHEVYHHCNRCPLKFTSEADLVRHFQENHQIENEEGHMEVIDFNNCGDESTQSSSVDVTSHMSAEELKKLRSKFFCKPCNYYFSSRDHANVHTGAKPYKCRHCNKTFGAKSNAQKHLRTVHKAENPHLKPFIYKKPEEKKYTCSICQKEFKNEQMLYNHGCQTTAGYSIFTCQICQKAYLGRSALVEHMLVHMSHPVTIVKEAS